MGGKALRKCEVCGVRRVRKCTSDIFLARFPLEPNRCRLWVKATGNEDLAYLPLYKLNENKFICGDHFPRNMYNEKGSRLKKFAVPTLNLVNPPLTDEILANIITTIKCLKDIWFDCQKRGFRYLNLRQLNQDSIENLFGIVRQTSPTNKNPTCTHFTSALKTILISGLKAPHSRGANCENDINKLLLLFSKDSDRSSDTTPLSGAQEDIEDSDEYPTIMLPETEGEEQIESDLCDIQNQPIVYLSGYLAYRLMKGNNCLTCSNLLQAKDAVDHPVYKYISLREWWKDKRSLTYPTISLCRTTEEDVLCFKSNLHIFHEENVGDMLFTLMTVQINFTWWSCNSHLYITKRILRLIKILIRRQCQINNEEFMKLEEISANANKISQAQSTAK